MIKSEKLNEAGTAWEMFSGTEKTGWTSVGRIDKVAGGWGLQIGAAEAVTYKTYSEVVRACSGAAPKATVEHLRSVALPAMPDGDRFLVTVKLVTLDDEIEWKVPSRARLEALYAEAVKGDLGAVEISKVVALRPRAEKVAA